MTALWATAAGTVPAVAAMMLGAACLVAADRRAGIATCGPGAFLAGAGFAWLGAAALLALPQLARLASSCC